MDYIGHAGSGSLLVLRLTNVHIQADERTICRYFDGYKIVDQIRTMNPKTRTLSAVYVMFGSVEDRNRALKNLNFGTILGRQIHIMSAHTGNYRINAAHNGFVHDEVKKSVAKPEQKSPAFNVLSSSEFPVLGNPTPASSPPIHVKVKHSTANRRPLHDKHAEVASETGITDALPKEVAAERAGDTTAIVDKPKKQTGQEPHAEQPRSLSGIAQRTAPLQVSPSAEKIAQPAPPFPDGPSDFFYNMPSALRHHYLAFSHPPPNPALLNPTVDAAAPTPPLPREDFSRPALDHTPPHKDFSRATFSPTSLREDFFRANLDHIFQPDVPTDEIPEQPYTDTAPRQIDTPIEPLGGLWNLSGDNDSAANVVSESEWYDFMPHLRREVPDILGILGIVARRTNREGGHGGGSEGRRW
ncbi:RRM-6 domain containing protein [Pyrenophora teres f. maculata]|nr:RRM-6 domain containing protein [Pyrenophora teres f. maculata]